MATLLTPVIETQEHTPAGPDLQRPARRQTNFANGHTSLLSLDIETAPDSPPVTIDRTEARSHALEEGQAQHPSSYVHGVSLSGILQMLSMERKTCVLEVTSEKRFGTITLVNGEPVDADVDGFEGDDAVYRILSWENPSATFMDVASLFRHTVHQPISHLLLESFRRQDEGNLLAQGPPVSAIELHDPAIPGHERPRLEATVRLSDWNWLVEVLIISGARTAAVIRARDERLLALADDSGRPVHDPSPSEIAELASIARSARRWARLVHPSITEIVARTNERSVLVAPVDPDHKFFAYVELDAAESFDLVRSAIRSMTR